VSGVVPFLRESHAIPNWSLRIRYEKLRLFCCASKREIPGNGVDLPAERARAGASQEAR